MPVVRPLAQPLLQDLEGLHRAVDLAVHGLVWQGGGREPVGAGKLRIDLHRVFEQAEQAAVDPAGLLRSHVAVALRQQLDGLEQRGVREQRTEAERERPRHVAGNGRDVELALDGDGSAILRRGAQQDGGGEVREPFAIDAEKLVQIHAVIVSQCLDFLLGHAVLGTMRHVPVRVVVKIPEH